MKANILVCDPPYIFSDKLKMSDVKRSAESNYAVLSDKDIVNLPVKDISAADSLIALWVPSSKLDIGLQILEAWGFAIKQTWIWVKIKKDPFKKFIHPKRINFHLIDPEDDISLFDANSMLAFGMGHWFRQSHELVLIGTRGKIHKHLQNRAQRSVYFWPVTSHSTKPEGLQNSLDIMFPDKKLFRTELFARRDRPGWHCIGLECPSTKDQDIKDSIERLSKL